MGLIKNKKVFLQKLDFSGLSSGRIYPTDIDAILEFNNKYLILIEVKRHNTKLPIGQRLVYERLCDSWVDSGEDKKAIAFILNNEQKDSEKLVVLKDCAIRTVYYNGRWKTKKGNFKDSLLKLSKNWDIEKLKLS